MLSVKCCSWLSWAVLLLLSQCNARVSKTIHVSEDEEDEMMNLLMKELSKSVLPDDHNAFIELCITKRETCREEHFNGDKAIFSWKLAATEKDRERFWRTYGCVYKDKPSLCPVDGGWSEWSLWSNCDATCEESGNQARIRVCENPKPTGGGDPCHGASLRNRSCIGLCIKGSNGRDEATQYLNQVHEIYSDLKTLCIDQHCLYDQVRAYIKDGRRADKYWSSVVCVKFGGACPVNGGWGEWGAWSDCSVQCGHGEQFRKRKCDKPFTQNGGVFCQGDWYEKKQCLSKNCAEKGLTFTDWSEFSSCSERCGKYGTKTSVRSCLSASPCVLEGRVVSEIAKSEPCFGGYCPNDGGWSKWGMWTECSARCGSGRRTRLRWCDSPFPYGGRSCFGPAIAVSSCSGSFCIQPPPDNDADEDDDKRKRRRRGVISSSGPIDKFSFALINEVWKGCTSWWNFLASKFVIATRGGHQPLGLAANLSETSTSNITLEYADVQRLATNALQNGDNLLRKMNLTEDQSDWKTTLDFDESGEKPHEVARPLTGRYPRDAADDGSRLPNNSRQSAAEIDTSDPYSVPLNSDLETLYTPWTDWSACSATCGAGTRQRRRQCNDKLMVCRGEVEPLQFCNIQPCPVAGAWSAWEAWTPCSVTCGTGKAERFRKCDNPLPTNGGACIGFNSRSQPCAMAPCPPHPAKAWSPWGEWSECSSSCGFGAKSRGRFRELMTDVQSEEVVCNAFPCPENGMWSAWGGWSSCTRPCGLGQTFRDRTCTDPAPVYNGLPCEGQGSDVQSCFAGVCTDDDDYGILLRGNSYVSYDPPGKSTGMLMVFIRFKSLRPTGTILHHIAQCTGEHSCKVSIRLQLVQRALTLFAHIHSRLDLTVKALSAIRLNEWNDVLMVVTPKWAELKLNDLEPQEKWFTGSVNEAINLDGILTVGATRDETQGFHGEMAVLRKNFKPYTLLPMKAWSGEGLPSKNKNVGKVSLSAEARHPNFEGKYFAHLFFRKSKFLQVSAVLQATGNDGLLFFNGGAGKSAFVSAALQKGGINFCLSCGEKSKCRKAYEVKTGQWFLLSFVVKGKEGVIRMNNGDAMQVMCPGGGEYSPRGSLYVGGAKGTDWDTMVDATKTHSMFYGRIDTLHLNGEAISFKMATLMSADNVINSLGYSLADHVTEVHGHHKSLTTLRCAFPETEKTLHFIKLSWLKNMALLRSDEFTEIVDTDSTEQSVSILNIFPNHKPDAVYACLENTDGELSILQVFVVLMYGNVVKDAEGEAEWVLFTVLVVFIVFIVLAVLAYCYYGRLLKLCTKRSKRKEKDVPLEVEVDDNEDNQPLLDETLEETVDEKDETDVEEEIDEQEEEMREMREVREAREAREVRKAREAREVRKAREVLSPHEDDTEEIEEESTEEDEEYDYEPSCWGRMERKERFQDSVRRSLDDLRQTLQERKNRGLPCYHVGNCARVMPPIHHWPFETSQQCMYGGVPMQPVLSPTPCSPTTFGVIRHDVPVEPVLSPTTCSPTTFRVIRQGYPRTTYLTHSLSPFEGNQQQWRFTNQRPSPSQRRPAITEINFQERWSTSSPYFTNGPSLQQQPPESKPTVPFFRNVDLMRFSPTKNENEQLVSVNDPWSASPQANDQHKVICPTPKFRNITPVNALGETPSANNPTNIKQFAPNDSQLPPMSSTPLPSGYATPGSTVGNGPPALMRDPAYGYAHGGNLSLSSSAGQTPIPRPSTHQPGRKSGQDIVHSGRLPESTVQAPTPKSPIVQPDRRKSGQAGVRGGDVALPASMAQSPTPMPSIIRPGGRRRAQDTLPPATAQSKARVSFPFEGDHPRSDIMEID